MYYYYHHLLYIFILLHTLVAPGVALIHDDSFQPDYVLRITAQNYSLACIERYSVLVNGTSPGPELRLREGKVSWIRVYNDMTDNNFTMVNIIIPSSIVWYVCQGLNPHVVALAWLDCLHCALLRRHSTEQPVAYCSRLLLRL